MQSKHVDDDNVPILLHPDLQKKCPSTCDDETEIGYCSKFTPGYWRTYDLELEVTEGCESPSDN